MSITKGTEHSREVRLGIVMYGGVSLAVYENGVAQELFRAVNGVGVYALLKELIDSDIVVDILSGTSAGGINGILLAYALTNNKDFRPCSNLWRDSGDILKLLRSPDDPSTLSVLDSEGYYQPALQAAFEKMPPYTPPAAGSRTEELDLFVTSTDVHGRIFTEFDDQGHPIDVKNHRQVFVLSYREGRKNEFRTADAAALGKLARATSCFPVAFAPVHVVSEKQPVEPGDDCLRRWGKLEHEAYFLDGGLLNNKPFSYTIDAIFRRTADRDVERMLFYVEPDPEHFTDDPPTAAPNVVQAAADALISIPGYQSIAADLQAIAEHNDRVVHYRELRDSIPADGLDTPALDADPAQQTIYLKSRLAQLRDAVVSGILKDHGRQQILRSKEDRRAARILIESFEKWPGSGSDTLINFDVYYRMRRLYHLVYQIKGRVYDDPAPLTDEARAEYRELWRRLNHQIQLLEMIEFAMEATMDGAPIEWRDLKDQTASDQIALGKWLAVEMQMKALLSTNGLPPFDCGSRDWKGREWPDVLVAQRQERDALMEALRERTSLLSKNTPPPWPVSGNLLHETDRIELEILNRYAPGGAQDVITFEYRRFSRIDSYMFPMEQIAGLVSKDVIHTVRISPVDAQRSFSAKTLAEKLCGKELGHFGGFLKRSWRVNDMMWGRLDAVCQLIECLLTPERLKKIDPSTFARAAANLPGIFSKSSPEDIAALSTAIANAQTYAAAGDEQAFEKLLDLLVAAAQSQIIQEEVPQVLKAAIDQQVEWNHYKIATKSLVPFSVEKQSWSVGTRLVDRAMAEFASGQIIAGSIPDSGWSIFFGSTYAVGSETWNRDIPLPVMLEIATNAMLVLRNCLLAIAGPERARQIRAHPVFKFGLDLPLRATYSFVRLQRTIPEYQWMTVGLLVFACIMLLGIGGVFWRDLWEPATGFIMHRFVGFILVPGLVLLAVLWFLARSRKRTQEGS
jgi:predicted acylesterase/phospholipase RssA